MTYILKKLFQSTIVRQALPAEKLKKTLPTLINTKNSIFTLTTPHSKLRTQWVNPSVHNDKPNKINLLVTIRNKNSHTTLYRSSFDNDVVGKTYKPTEISLGAAKILIKDSLNKLNLVKEGRMDLEKARQTQETILAAIYSKTKDNYINKLISKETELMSHIGLDKTDDEKKEQKIAIETYCKQIGEIARNAGLKGETDESGIFTPSGAGANVFNTSLISPLIKGYSCISQNKENLEQLINYADNLLADKFSLLSFEIENLLNQPTPILGKNEQLSEQLNNKHLIETLNKLSRNQPEQFKNNLESVSG